MAFIRRIKKGGAVYLIRNGYHKVEIITKMGKSEYSERFLIILRRNIVIEYYKGDSNFKVPYFRTRTMFKEFFPD